MLVQLNELPEYAQLGRNLMPKELELINNFWGSLWNNYIKNKGTTSSIFWVEKIGALAFNKTLIILKDKITIKTLPDRNWSEVSLNNNWLETYFDSQLLENHRKQYKTKQYLPGFTIAKKYDQVKIGNTTKATGLKRKGFMKSANTQFGYDVNMLNKYKQEIIINVNKGMTKMREQYHLPLDNASYDVVSEDIVNYISNNPQEVYTLGTSKCDSRGRAIKGALKSVANPIGYKDFRALLVIPEEV